jgi:hypothetical protein
VGGFGRLAQVASRQQGVMEPIATIEQENIDVAVELAVLKSVVEDVHRWQVKLEDVWRRRGLGKLAGTEALTGNEDGDAGFAGDQKRFVSKIVGCAIGVDAGGALAQSSIAAGENVNAEAAALEGLGERDGERRFARAAGGEITNADDRTMQAVDWLEPGAKAKLAQEKGKAVCGHQGEEQFAR